MPSPHRNGDIPPRVTSPTPAGTPHHHHYYPNFHSTVSAQKLRRLNTLILILRFAAFCFSLASAVFMSTNSSRYSGSPSWTDFDAFRLVFAAGAIVAVYSFFEMGVSLWEILKGVTLLPEAMQLWFDFGHDQMFAYLLLSAGAAGVEAARGLKRRHSCTADNSAFCVQADISVVLSLAGFGFLAASALVSGFRVACYVITGARFHS